jgi:hypothetical protein
VDLTDHPDEDVVCEGVSNSFGTFAMDPFPTFENERDSCIIDSTGIESCKGMEGSKGAEVTFGSGRFDGGHEVRNPVGRC